MKPPPMQRTHESGVITTTECGMSFLGFLIGGVAGKAAVGMSGKAAVGAVGKAAAGAAGKAIASEVAAHAAHHGGAHAAKAVAAKYAAGKYAAGHHAHGAKIASKLADAVTGEIQDRAVGNVAEKAKKRWWGGKADDGRGGGK